MMSFAGAVHMVVKLRASPRLATNGDSKASGKEPSNLGKAKIACSLAPATFFISYTRSYKTRCFLSGSGAYKKFLVDVLNTFIIGDTLVNPSMASAALTFSSTKETTNYARLSRLLLDVGSQVLRETFDKKRPPGRLDSVLGSPSVSATLQSLRRKNILSPSQWSKLYPAIKSSVSSEKFDITLLIVLLRSICGLTPPATGWDALPSPEDLSCEADISRIKFYRNKVYAHATRASIGDTECDNYWKTIGHSLVRLGGADYELATDGLKNDCLVWTVTKKNTTNSF